MIACSSRRVGLLVLLAGLALAPPVQAAKEKFERTKPHCNVGTIGHVDHGKTTLTAAITKVSGAKLRSSSTRPWENAACGDEARIAFAPFVNALVKHADFIAGVRQDLVFTSDDMTRFMLTGTSAPNGDAQMDGAILVVSAADGPMPQTREHVLLARQVGVPAPLVYVNQIGVVTPELVERTTSQVIDLLVDEGYDPADVHVFSGDAGAVARGEGDAADVASVEQLVEAVIENVPLPEPARDKPFLMPIEDVFSIRGRGTAVTGTIERGTVVVGDELELVGGEETNRSARVVEIVRADQLFPDAVEEAEAGDAVELLLDVDPATVGDGMVIAKPGSIRPIHSASVKIYVPTQAEGGAAKRFFPGYRPQFYIRTSSVTGTVDDIEGGDELAPGSIGTIQVELDRYVPDVPGASIPICDPDTGSMSGVGMIVD